ncbi:hypothetical protein FEM48_Zijuj02G0053000 [Ziziphus jujuba var. spinosa]|uniref:Phosphoinositide phospholipase C n=1 Tax=Ziziphus jujuba var. spinosa TaxID=714518 RepID=A0A978VTV1_ZIZJJ|nr:hypothetical protein FEM48_Zijuj02G0053000 [Ziziphus jujuba var. spinosa]
MQKLKDYIFAFPPYSVAMKTEKEKERMSDDQAFKVCFCFRRIFRLRKSEPPEDVKELFAKYSDNGTMTIEHFYNFLNEFQGEKDVTKEEAQNRMNSLKHIFQRKGLHLDAFFRYLLGDQNPPHISKVHHDMSAPLAHYFMFTGHNSYLTGNQLNSDSSVVPIIKSLERGVRVIELDLWPNPANDDVDVRHGGTMTSRVKLADCLSAIKDHAFKASKYPVVITFEDHLPSSLQKKVAKMVINTFGDMLYCPEVEFMMEFPSPESLKERIMISTKPPENPVSQRVRERQSSKDSANEENWEEQNNGYEDQQDDRYDDEETAVLEYKKLIAIHARKPKGKSNMWEVTPLQLRRLSLSEQELETAAKNHGTDIVRFTQKNLLRIYPKGLRFDSSNYDPMVGWTHGAQMVAFNMQGHGKYLRIMEGMFRANGGCGYVKKPDILLNSTEVFNPHVNLPVQKKLKIKVYMGEGWDSDFRRTHFDRFSPPDFFTKVSIAGVPSDIRSHKTKTIEDQWIPVWNEEFEFPLSVPELAVLLIQVLEYDTSGKHDFGGQICLPVSELRTGIRAVSLHNRKGEKYRSVRLLMRFEFVKV